MFKAKSFQSLAMVLAAGVLVGAVADRAISRLDVRAMSEGQKNRQVRSDLLSILRPSKSLFEANTLSIGDVWLHTSASAAQYRSLCQRDTVLLFYAPLDKAGPPEDWRSQPYKVESRRSYRFVSAPKPDYLTAAEEDDRSPFDPDCNKANAVIDGNEWTGWFTADTPDDAMDGGFAMLALQEWVKRADTQFESCRTAPEPAECKNSVGYAINLNSIGRVGKCTAEKPGELCIGLGNYETIFTIRARKTGRPMQPEDIITADFEDQIIVT